MMSISARWLAVVEAWRKRPWLGLVALAGLVILAYLPVWHAGFIWDDNEYVVDNVLLNSVGGLRAIWDTPGALAQYYPLVFTSFWLEHHLWGLHPAGYHAVNLLLHALNAWLVWRLLRAWRVPGAWWAALIFAVHPVHVESVAWITERKNLLSAACSLGALLAMTRWAGLDGTRPRGARWYALGLVLFAGAMLSKTVSCTIPAAWLAVVWWRRGEWTRRDLVGVLPMFVLGLALAWLTMTLEHRHLLQTAYDWSLNGSQRVLIAGRAAWFYLGKLAWPHPLIFIYPRWSVDAQVWWQWLFPAAAVAAVVALWALRRRIGRGPLAATLWFGILVSPTLGLIDFYPMRYTFVADHYQYLASLGPLALLAAGLSRPTDRWTQRRCAVVLTGLLMVLGILTWRQSRDYRDLKTLWTSTLAKSPSCWMAHNNLATILLDQPGALDRTESHLRAALALKPEYPEAQINLGIVLIRRSRPTEATHHFLAAMRYSGDVMLPYQTLGVLLSTQGPLKDQVGQLAEQLRQQPGSEALADRLGLVLLYHGDFESAREWFAQLTARQPNSAFAFRYYGRALQGAGRSAEAAKAYRRALDLDPRDFEVINNLAVVLMQTGHVEEAVNYARQATRLAPFSAGAWANLAVVLEAQGKSAQAASARSKSLALRPVPAAQ